MRRTALALAAFCVTGCLTVTGCTAERVPGEPIGLGSDSGTAFDEPTGVPSESAPTGEPPPPAGTAPPGPAETVPGFPTAKDGSDIAACYDGTCEVEVRAPLEIPLDPSTGLTSLTLVRVDDVDGATLTGTTTGGGSVDIVVYADPGGTAVVTINNQFSVVALATVHGRAVLRFAPV